MSAAPGDIFSSLLFLFLFSSLWPPLAFFLASPQASAWPGKPKTKKMETSREVAQKGGERKGVGAVLAPGKGGAKEKWKR